MTCNDGKFLIRLCSFHKAFGFVWFCIQETKIENYREYFFFFFLHAERSLTKQETAENSYFLHAERSLTNIMDVLCNTLPKFTTNPG